MSKTGAKGQGKGNSSKNPSDLSKAMQDILKAHQVQNIPKFLKSLANVGFKVPKASKGQAKGNGKDKAGGSPPAKPPKVEKSHPGGKSKGKGKGPKPKSKDGESGQPQSFYSGSVSSGLKRPAVAVIGSSITAGITMVCHVPT